MSTRQKLMVIGVFVLIFSSSVVQKNIISFLTNYILIIRIAKHKLINQVLSLIQMLIMKWILVSVWRRGDTIKRLNKYQSAHLFFHKEHQIVLCL